MVMNGLYNFLDGTEDVAVAAELAAAEAAGRTGVAEAAGRTTGAAEEEEGDDSPPPLKASRASRDLTEAGAVAEYAAVSVIGAPGAAMSRRAAAARRRVKSAAAGWRPDQPCWRCRRDWSGERTA
jgi:hypothetical protein